MVVCCGEEEGPVEHGEGCDCCEGDGEEAGDVEFWGDAGSKEVGEDCGCVEEGHLFEAKGRDEVEACPERTAADETGNGGEDEAEHDCVVLEVAIVD